MTADMAGFPAVPPRPSSILVPGSDMPAQPRLRRGQYSDMRDLAQRDQRARSIMASLVAFWEFRDNDTGSVFLDSHGENHLLLRGTSGPLRVCDQSTALGGGSPFREFTTGTTEKIVAYVPRANKSIDLPDADWTFGAYFRPINGAVGTGRHVIGRTGSTDPQSVAYLWTENADNKTYFYGCDVLGNFPRPPTGYQGSVKYVLMACSLNRTLNRLEFRFQDTNFATMQYSQVAFPNKLVTTASVNANFCFGGPPIDTDGANYYSGTRQGLVSVTQGFYMSKVITDAEFAYLYNSSAAVSYAELNAGRAVMT
jgi:hypothetical protein